MKISYFGYTTRGVRNNNEDSFATGSDVWADDTKEISNGPESFQLDDNWQIFAIADGMGGHASGEIASRMTLAQLTIAFQENKDWTEIQIRDLIKGIHDEILLEGADSLKYGMGCTLSGIAIREGAAWLFNVGDSRTYQFKQGYLSQLTTDHSMRAFTGNQNVAQNQLYSCIGAGQKEFTLDIWDLSAKIKSGISYFISSDGYHEFMDIDTLEKILVAPLDKEQLIGEARNAITRGSQDNVTIIVVNIFE